MLVRRSAREQSPIIDAIIAELEPLRSGMSRNDAERDIRSQLNAMQKEMQLFHRPSLKENRDSAKKIRSTIRRLKYQVATAPPAIQSHIHVGDYPVRGPLPTVLEMLNAMDKKLADHVTLSAASDRIKFACAARGHDIMLRCSQKAPASSSANSALRVIASLIYEHCTRKRQDLERACEAALRRKVDPRPGMEFLDEDPHARMLWYDLEERFIVWRRNRSPTSD
jgi:hypothetical protein